MRAQRRVNVNSGRQLEQLAHYSRALRVGDTVLQSGTTAIDLKGNVIGEGDVARQVDTIIDIAETSMGKAGGRLEDVVRCRIYITDIGLADAAGRAMARHFRDNPPATTVFAVNRLARPAQLIEIELDAIDGAKHSARRLVASGRAGEEYRYSSAVRVDERVFVGGVLTSSDTPPTGDVVTQARNVWEKITENLVRLDAELGDLVYTKTFVTDLTTVALATGERLRALGETRPVETLLAVPNVINGGRIEIEAEALVGAADTRREIYTQNNREYTTGYARAVVVGDRIYVAGCTATDSSGAVNAKGDWAAQYDYCHRNIQWALQQAGATLDDVIRRRTFTVVDAEQNRPHGEGPGWFVNSRPVSLGCRITGLAHPDMWVEIDAVAIKGARENIEWLEL